MQFNYNYDWQECIGDGTGLVTRNLWSWLESKQLQPTTKTYDNFTGIWYDNWVYGNNAYVSGSSGQITPTTSSFGGYDIKFTGTGCLEWRNSYTQGPTPFNGNGASIFIQWQQVDAFTTGAIALFTTTQPSSSGASYNTGWYGGSNQLLSGNSQYRYGWPGANEYTTSDNTSSFTAALLSNDQTLRNNELNVSAWNHGVGFGIDGTKVLSQATGGGSMQYLRNNTDLTHGGYDWTNYKLRFGRQSYMVYPWVAPDGSQITNPFQGIVKRILIYNSTLSMNEVYRNMYTLQSLP